MPAFSLPPADTTPFGMACISGGTLPYPRLAAGRSFGVTLSPDHYRCPPSRPVSYYALFKWWLLLSQHPGCRRKQTSLSTERDLGALAGGLGCFPFVHEHYRPHTHSRDSRRGIRSLIEGGSREDPAFHSVALPPRRSGPRLPQKAFRGEPDISTFD